MVSIDAILKSIVDLPELYKTIEEIKGITMSSQQGFADVQAEIAAQGQALTALLNTIVEEQLEVKNKIESLVNQLDDASATQFQEVLFQLRGNTDKLQAALKGAEAISGDVTEESAESIEEQPTEPIDPGRTEPDIKPADTNDVAPVNNSL